MSKDDLCYLPPNSPGIFNASQVPGAIYKSNAVPRLIMKKSQNSAKLLNSRQLLH